MQLLTTFALISNERLINTLWYLGIWALIMGVLWWAAGQWPAPEPWNKIIRAVLVILTVVVLLNLLLPMAGRP